MTLTAVSVLRIRWPRAFAAVAVGVLLLGSCDPGEGETPSDPAAAPVESGEGSGAAAEAPAEAVDEPEGGPEAGAPPAGVVHAAAAGPGAVVPAVAPSPPPRPSPVADAPPPPRREEPELSPDEAIERACRPPVGEEVRSLVGCGHVADSYRRLMDENRSCSSDDDCHVIEGSCAIGLGGCWYAVARSVTYDDADRLTARYRELACTGPVCRCAAPPTRAVCDEGVCTAGS